MGLLPSLPGCGLVLLLSKEWQGRPVPARAVLLSRENLTVGIQQLFTRLLLLLIKLLQSKCSRGLDISEHTRSPSIVTAGREGVLSMSLPTLEDKRWRNTQPFVSLQALHSITRQTPPRTSRVAQAPLAPWERLSSQALESGGCWITAMLLFLSPKKHKIMASCFSTQTFKWGHGLYLHLFRVVHIFLAQISINLC